MPLGGAFVWDLRAHLHVILTALNNDRHPEAPARLRGPRRMAASAYVRPTLRGSLRSHLRVTDELLLALLVSVLPGAAAQKFLVSFELQLDHVSGRLVGQFERLLV